MMTKTVRYRNWWPNFNPELSFIPRLVKRATGCHLAVVREPHVEVDYEIHSVFCDEGIRNRLGTSLKKRSGDPKTRRDARMRADYGIGERGPAQRYIWYTGENLRPPEDWDVTLSFDLDPLLGQNWYLPHWAIRLGDLDGHDPSDAFRVDNKSLIDHRESPEARRGFAVLLAGNPHPMRQTLCKALSSVGEVRTFGSAYGKPVSSKMDTLRQYRFAIVPENDLYPGYVTEKVLEASLAGCIPIWWGLDPAGYLNKNAHINLATMSLSELVRVVREIDNDQELMNSITSQPILERPYDFESCLNFIRPRLKLSSP